MELGCFIFKAFVCFFECRLKPGMSLFIKWISGFGNYKN